MSKMFSFYEIGLETRDKRVYEALYANPKSSLRSIADTTGINRGSVYESIKQLVEHGLAGSIQVGKQKRYTATEPTIIVELLKEQQQQAIAAEAEAETYIQLLKNQQATASQPDAFATFYEDHEGVATILRDVITTCSGRNGNAYRVISTSRVRQYMYNNFPNFTQRRIAENISVRVIAVGQGGAKDALSDRRWIEAKRGDAINCYTILYGNKTAFITLGTANVLSGIVIDNAGVTQLQKELFDKQWNDLV